MKIKWMSIILVTDCWFLQKSFKVLVIFSEKNLCLMENVAWHTQILKCFPKLIRIACILLQLLLWLFSFHLPLNYISLFLEVFASNMQLKSFLKFVLFSIWSYYLAIKTWFCISLYTNIFYWCYLIYDVLQNFRKRTIWWIRT